MQVERICQYHCHTGEAPMWHADERCLYWVDIPQGLMFRYDPASGGHEQVYHDRPVGGLTIQADGSLLLFRDRGNIVRWRGGEVVETVIDHIPDEVHTRFNDVAADPQGRVFCGTMPSRDPATGHERLGRLYRLDPDGSLRIVVDGVGCANGIGFTSDLCSMYFTDSTARTIWLYDYDRATGEITNRRPFVTVRPPAMPDGLTVDADGNVWSARWGGHGAVRHARDGAEIGRIDVPTRNVSSVMFGGTNLDELYITTASDDDPHPDPATAGALFRVRPGVRGRPEFRSRTGL